MRGQSYIYNLVKTVLLVELIYGGSICIYCSHSFSSIFFYLLILFLSVIRGLLARKHFNHMQGSKKLNLENANSRQKSDRRISDVKVLFSTCTYKNIFDYS